MIRTAGASSRFPRLRATGWRSPTAAAMAFRSFWNHGQFGIERLFRQPELRTRVFARA
jgi:hypothetical protein